MALDSNDIWQPTADYIDRAQVTALSKRLGATDIDALYDLSLAEPERYWREVTSFCNIRWSRDYDSYCGYCRSS